MRSVSTACFFVRRDPEKKSWLIVYNYDLSIETIQFQIGYEIKNK